MPAKCMLQEVAGLGFFFFLEEMAFELNFDRISIGKEGGKKI